MAEKRLYWLKMPSDFLTDKVIKKLRTLPGGDTYTIIALKLLLKALNEDNRLYFDGIEDTFSEEIALDIGEQPEAVDVTVKYLIGKGWLIPEGDNCLYVVKSHDMTGSETATAERMRRSRESKKKLESKAAKELPEPNSSNNVTDSLQPVTNGYIDIDIEKEIDISSSLHSDDCLSKPDDSVSGNEKPMVQNEREPGSQEIVDLFNDICEGHPKCKILTPERKVSIRARLREFGFDKIRDVFHKARDSDFLSGRTDKGFNPGFDWVMKKSNFIKILEGNYDNDRFRSLPRRGGYSGTDDSRYLESGKEETL